MTEPIDEVRPLFQGLRPDVVFGKVSGSFTDTHVARNIGESVTFVVVATVNGIAHQRDKDGRLVRTQSIAVEHAYEVPDGYMAEDLVVAYASEARALADLVRGFTEMTLDEVSERNGNSLTITAADARNF